ncbi:hypothetical protein Dimus_031048 [Dionaea muscipula]
MNGLAVRYQVREPQLAQIVHNLLESFPAENSLSLITAEMPKIFNGFPSHGRFLQTFFSCFKIPRFLPAVSFLHYTKQNPDVVSKLGFLLNELEDLQSSAKMTPESHSGSEFKASREGIPSSTEKPTFQIAHPWPEWVDLMEVLLKRGYFDEIGNPFGNGGEVGTKDTNLIRTACLNFGRDRLDLVRYLSRRHIQVIVGFGCPSTDRKVVNSGKRLRAHVGIDEGNVCSACSLRGDCDRAYVKAREDEVGRTVDVMRILLTYGLDPVTGSIENKQCQTETVKKSARRLLKQMFEFSQLEPDQTTGISGKETDSLGQKFSEAQGQIEVPTKQGDWICPKCSFLNFARNIKCLRCNGVIQDRFGKSEGEDHDHLPLKKGDWICEKCNFLNFAKNSKCLQCEEKPPKRQLNSGEWECESCRYINFRKNAECLRCDYKRPKASNSSNPSSEVGHEKVENTRSMMRSVNDEAETNGKPNISSEQGDQRRSSNTWRFVEEDDEVKHNVGNNMLVFMDFPINGGASELSRDKHKIEQWKLDMVERRRNPGKQKAQELPCPVNSRPMFLQCTNDVDDDDEMDDWFRKNKHDRIGNR